ncbi:MAG: heme exporter protein CcmB, partial [Raoultibacter sp.]
MAPRIVRPSTFKQYKNLLAKDMQQEFRTKEMLTSMGIYALLVLVVYGAALAQTSSTLDILQMSGGLLWALIVFTSLLGLNRSFAHEKEQGCLEGILLVPLDRSVIFLAKATSNLLFLLVVEVIAVPLFYF